MVKNFIVAPRNRVEMRVGETPPAFENQTPYEYIKALHTFQTLLFIYLSGNPEWIQRLTYNSRELQAAKHNEYTILNQGLDGKTYWPNSRRETTGRAMLKAILNESEFKNLANILGMNEDLEIIRRIAEKSDKPPAERMREEIAKEYKIDARQSGIDRFLHGEDPDRYPKDILARTRAAMARELKQIESELSSVPSADQPFLTTLVTTIKTVRSYNPF